MKNQNIRFQLATHFLSRIALRLECLLNIIHQACDESHTTIHRYALKSLVEVIDIIEKPELKSRFLKELMRMEYVLKKSNSSINYNLVEFLGEQIHRLSNVPGAFTSAFKNQPFLNSVKHIHQPNSKECEFNSPQLLMWLDMPAEERQHDLQGWLKLLEELDQTVGIYLTIMRETACYSTITAQYGYYHYTLPPKSPCHLILVEIDKTLNLIPKLQLSHHGLTIRLYELPSFVEVKESSIDMDIAVCQL